MAIDTIDQELRRLVAAATQGDGIAVLTAAPGAGKTLVCQRLRDELSPRFEAVVLSSSGFATRRALLQAVLFALGRSYESCSEQELRLSVLNYARTLAATCEGIVLIVDEAHLLNNRLLEELRCLTNHSQAGHPLIRVVLCGQLPLEEALVDPALEALNYRITCHATLEPLSMHESARLVAGRLQRAGSSIEAIFTPEALETICRVSDGNLRCLVQLCDESLRIAAEAGEAPVEAETVRVALHQLKQLPLQWNESAIDQPQSTADTARQADPPAGPSWDSEPDIDSSSGQLGTGQQSDVDEQPLGWSAQVCSVELGAGSELRDTPPVTAGWSSFEPESGWGPSNAVTFDEEQDADATIPCCGGRDTLPVPTSQPRADDVRGRGRGDVHDFDSRGSATVQACSRDEWRDGFVELPVDDVYAALDARTRRQLAACDTGSLDEVSPSPQTNSPRNPRKSVREPIEDADPSGQYEPLSDLPHRPQTDPVQRLDDVIAALAAITGQGSGPQSRSDNECAEYGDWQSAGDCRDYGIIEAGGEPHWDEQLAELSRAIRANDSGLPGPRGADRQEAAPGGRADPGRQRLRRPYARLFSRARQQQS